MSEFEKHKAITSASEIDTKPDESLANDTVRSGGYIHATISPFGYFNQVCVNGDIQFLCIEASEIGGWAKCFAAEADRNSRLNPPKLRSMRLKTVQVNGIATPTAILLHGQVAIRSV